MSTRPVAVALAAAIITILGSGAVLFGLFWLTVLAGATAILAPSGIAGLIGIVSIAYGAAAFVAAIGIARGRPWAWIVSIHVAIVAVAGSLLATVTAGPQPAVLVGAALPVAALLALLGPAVRASPLRP